MEIKLVFFTFFVIITLPHSQCVQPKKILFYSAISTHSIRLSMWPIMEALADKGHNVTFLSPLENLDDPQQKSKVHYVTPKKWKKAMGSWESSGKYYDIRKQGAGPKGWLQIREIGVTACEHLYSDPEFIDWVWSSQFDLVIVETLMNECAYGMIHLWKAKLIVYSTTTVCPPFHDAHGLPDETSSISELLFAFPPGDKMTFLQRFVNALNPIVFTLTRDYQYLPKLEEITRKGLHISEKEELPSFREIEKNASLLMLTSHFSLDYPRSLPPYAVPVGGLVVTKKQKSIPTDMEDFINSAKDGFIFISFGTVVDLTNWDENVQIGFINALEKFPDMKYIWKITNDVKVRQLPKNVLLTKWAPQQTLLAHPKIKAFITHGGMGSVTEAAHFSVPLICIPSHADQDVNSNLIEERNAGIKLEMVDLQQEEVEHAITEILYNPKYRNGMTRLTQIFKDRPMPPLENAVWWIEYVLKHDNTNEFLRPPSIHLSWYKRRNVDIWATVALLVSLIMIIPLFIIICLLKLIFKIIYKRDSSSFPPRKVKRS